MRISILVLLVFITIHCNVFCAKLNVKSLTKELGQEIIELSSPIKELSVDLDEEPAAEHDDDESKDSKDDDDEDDDETKSPTTVAIQPATKKDMKKPADGSRIKIQRAGNELDNDEVKMEKELADFYKDTSNSNDYNGDASEASVKTNMSATVSSEVMKPIARSKNKFQPDINNKKDVEVFRTSIDDISCGKGATQKLKSINSARSNPDSAHQSLPQLFSIGLLAAFMIIGV